MTKNDISQAFDHLADLICILENKLTLVNRICGALASSTSYNAYKSTRRPVSSRPLKVTIACASSPELTSSLRPLKSDLIIVPVLNPRLVRPLPTHPLTGSASASSAPTTRTMAWRRRWWRR